MATPPTAELDAHPLSHVGNVRADNQDALNASLFPDQAGALYAVADGMGGYEHGGIASAVALETLIATLSAQLASQTMLQANSIEQALRRGVQDANVRVYQEAVRLNARMGTTLTAAYITGATLHLAHVGDSRAYLIRKGKASCLTNDHTGVGEMVRARILSPDKVRTHAQRSVLNRCLGLELFIQPEISRVSISSGDVIVLCSDGLWSAVEDDDIAALADNRTSAESISERLVARALANDSDDNVSAWTICARYVPEAAALVAAKRWSFPALLRGRSHAG